MSESVVLCEGFHDRAFWAGWLAHLGCSDEGFRPGTPGYPAADPWGVRVAGGHFAYRSASGGFVRVRPCGGRGNILPAVRIRLQQRTSKAVARLVINIDPDTPAGPATAATGLRLEHVLNLATALDPAAAQAADEILVDGGATRLCLVRWEADDPPADGVPNQQTLERLACCAITAAYPDRAPVVKNWLDARPAAPVAGPKEHAWSYMAGWYADHGCEDFYGNLWRDQRIAAELRSRLERAGAWRVAEALAS
jgi:hypothetical protein